MARMARHASFDPEQRQEREERCMASDKIRLGVIGANPTVGWAPRAHLPALVASPDIELTAVCTTRQESATASAQKYGAKMAFHDYRDMLACPDIDAVAARLPGSSPFQTTPPPA